MLKYQAIILCFCLMVVVSSSSKTDEMLRSLLSKYSERRNERLYKDDHSVMNSLKIEAPVMDERGEEFKRSSSEITLSQAWRDEILALHNTARSGVNPSPVNALPALTWDSNLATIAIEWALQCEYGHNSERSANHNGYVGENIALYYGVTNYNALIKSVNGWINEVDVYNYSSNTCQAGKKCGHYTQVVWDDTTTVGCAMALCPTVTNVPAYFVNAQFLVCNYSPGGNMMVVGRPYQSTSQC